MFIQFQTGKDIWLVESINVNHIIRVIPINNTEMASIYVAGKDEAIFIYEPYDEVMKKINEAVAHMHIN